MIYSGRMVISSLPSLATLIIARLRGLFRGTAPISFFTLAASLAGTGYGAGEIIAKLYATARESSLRFELWVAISILATLASCSMAFILIHNPRRYRIWMGIKIALLQILILMNALSAITAMGMLSILIIEIAIYEAYYLNLVISVLTVTVSVITHSISAADEHEVATSLALARETVDRFWFALYPLLVAVTSCIFVRFREMCIDRDESISRLDNAVSKLAQSNLGYQNYAQEAGARSQRDERLRITREIHDIIGYTFTNNIMMLEAAIAKINKDPVKVRELIRLARESAESGLQKIRNSLRLLRSSEPAHTTSLQRIHTLVKVFRVATGVDVNTQYTNAPNELPEQIEDAFYFFVQEALTNAFRHGEATSIRVYFHCTDDRLVASVLDNGKGTNSVEEGIGISGMRERFKALGGGVTLVKPPSGFEVIAEVPLTGGGNHG